MELTRLAALSVVVGVAGLGVAAGFLFGVWWGVGVVSGFLVAGGVQSLRSTSG
jgi:hypothetical protein